MYKKLTGDALVAFNLEMKDVISRFFKYLDIYVKENNISTSYFMNQKVSKLPKEACITSNTVSRMKRGEVISKGTMNKLEQIMKRLPLHGQEKYRDPDIINVVSSDSKELTVVMPIVPEKTEAIGTPVLSEELGNNLLKSLKTPKEISIESMLDYKKFSKAEVSSMIRSKLDSMLENSNIDSKSIKVNEIIFTDAADNSFLSVNNIEGFIVLHNFNLIKVYADKLVPLSKKAMLTEGGDEIHIDIIDYLNVSDSQSDIEYLINSLIYRTTICSKKILLDWVFKILYKYERKAFILNGNLKKLLYNYITEGKTLLPQRSCLEIEGLQQLHIVDVIVLNTILVKGIMSFNTLYNIKLTVSFISADKDINLKSVDINDLTISLILE